MIKIEFTCYKCGESSAIGEGDIDEKAMVPVCDTCYGEFSSRKSKLIKSFTKKLQGIYDDYGIPKDTFNAGEDISIDD